MSSQAKALEIAYKYGPLGGHLISAQERARRFCEENCVRLGLLLNYLHVQITENGAGQYQAFEISQGDIVRHMRRTAEIPGYEADALRVDMSFLEDLLAHRGWDVREDKEKSTYILLSHEMRIRHLAGEMNF